MSRGYRFVCIPVECTAPRRRLGSLRRPYVHHLDSGVVRRSRGRGRRHRGRPRRGGQGTWARRSALGEPLGEPLEFTLLRSQQAGSPRRLEPLKLPEYSHALEPSESSHQRREPRALPPESGPGTEQQPESLQQPIVAIARRRLGPSKPQHAESQWRVRRPPAATGVGRQAKPGEEGHAEHRSLGSWRPAPRPRPQVPELRAGSRTGTLAIQRAESAWQQRAGSNPFPARHQRRPRPGSVPVPAIPVDWSGPHARTVHRREPANQPRPRAYLSGAGPHHSRPGPAGTTNHNLRQSPSPTWEPLRKLRWCPIRRCAAPPRESRRHPRV